MVEKPVVWHANKIFLVIFGVVNVLFYKTVELYFGGQMSNDWLNGQTVQAIALKALTTVNKNIFGPFLKCPSLVSTQHVQFI